MASTMQWVGLVLAVGLVLLPEPITTATGTIVGLGIIATLVGAKGVSPA